MHSIFSQYFLVGGDHDGGVLGGRQWDRHGGWLCDCDITGCRDITGTWSWRWRISHLFQQLFTFNFFLSAILNLNVLSLKLTATGDKPFHLVAMEQNHDHDNSLEKKLIARVTNEQREKSNKCSLCDYASSHAGHLRTHLKMHSGERPNKCSQCNFASSTSSNLRRNSKRHNGEK